MDVEEHDPLAGSLEMGGSTSHGGDPKRANTRRVQRMTAAFAFVYVILICLYFTFITAPTPVWFHWHPILASLGVYSFFVYAVILKRQGKTRQHAYMTFIGTALAAAGIWVAYQDKSSRNKNHFVSTHAQLGLTSLLVTVPYPFISWIFLNPDNGLTVGNRSIRTIHRLLGQGILCICFSAFGLGLAKYEKNNVLLTLWLILTCSVVPIVFL